MNLAFGNNWNAEVASELVQEFTQSNFSNLPEIEILPSATLDGANGAFASVNNTIYLSQEFIAQNAGNPEAITSVLLEETGHYIDSKVNVRDADGDEGDIFARLAQGKTISADTLLALKAEDDSATITLAGKDVLIEQSSTFRGTVDAQVNVRSGPGTNFGVVGVLNLGNSRTFDSVNTGTTHWDAREGKNENRWFRLQGTNNWVSAAFITGTPHFSGSVDAQLNVRSGPGTNFGIVSSLNAGNRPTFDGVNVGTTHWDAREGKNENRWFRLQGTDNWVSAAFITGEPTNNLTPPQTPPQTPLLTRQGPDYFRARPQFYTTGNIFHISGYGSSLVNNGGRTEGNCTWYAHGRVKELGGSSAALNSMWGNANQWHTQLSNGARILGSNESLQPGDIAQWSGNGQNHVAVVEAVHSNGTITISEAHYNTNWDGGGAGTLHHVRQISASNPTRYIRVPRV